MVDATKRGLIRDKSPLANHVLGQPAPNQPVRNQPVLNTPLLTGPVLPRPKPLLMRELLGESLREERAAQGRTLRDISRQAQVSLGYLSEVERGQKEASSELLAAICQALNVPMSVVLHQVSEKMAVGEQVVAHEGVTRLPIRAMARAAA